MLEPATDLIPSNLAPILRPNESILWAGAPDAARVGANYNAFILFGLLSCVFGGFLLWVGLSVSKEALGLIGSAVVAMPFVVGAVLMSVPAVTRARANKTRYLITNERLIIARTDQPSIESFVLGELSNCERTEYGVGGDVAWSISSTTRTSARSKKARVTLMGIENAKVVENLVHDLRKQGLK